MTDYQTRTSNPKKSQVRADKVAGATSVSRRCDNGESYIAVGLSKFAARDAARCKDQMSLHAEVSLDEPVNGEETDGDT